MATVNTDKLSSARFAQATDAFVEIFTASVDFDQRMAIQDIEGSLVHAKMLCKIGILTETERDDIINGLATITKEIDRGEFKWSIQQEDVHMNIEARLTDLIGIAGKNCTLAAPEMTRLQLIYAFIYVKKLTLLLLSSLACKSQS